MSKSDNSIHTVIDYCPYCDEFREPSEFEYLGLVKELGNIPRFRCKTCAKVFETLPPDTLPLERESPSED